MSLQHDLPYLTTRIDIKAPNSKGSIGTGFFFES